MRVSAIEYVSLSHTAAIDGVNGRRRGRGRRVDGGGLAAGLACSLSLMSFVRSLLFGIRPIDPLVMITAAAVFLAAAFIAGGLPASRAAAIDPTVALRHE